MGTDGHITADVRFVTASATGSTMAVFTVSATTYATDLFLMNDSGQNKHATTRRDMGPTPLNAPINNLTSKGCYLIFKYAIRIAPTMHAILIPALVHTAALLLP